MCYSSVNQRLVFVSFVDLVLLKNQTIFEYDI